ncbi:hypothetical protein PNIG_a3478 [Pseudoalteromonas nigrifaciens]|uniref:Orphan protein n=3 Tax=Pseudoalteromonas TaxID=53246 RepID=Q3IJC6_PSET1|nr:hypothetical protein PTRA_a3263 [Pseudoalteromonas translucida KMM 520]ASM55370.1 hypothetical protein PNIG_a3478 [Pseudoalteromonas nigrifaciens]CAI87775.1 putative orphan protein [Pseudoalteromonas translucida]
MGEGVLILGPNVLKIQLKTYYQITLFTQNGYFFSKNTN